MGYDGFYTEQSDIFRKNREYFIQTEAGPVKIGESCGHRTQHFTADRDGDGITELICKCHASLGSARWIRVFRRNGNVIKTGIVEWDTLKKKLTDCAWEKSNYPSLWTDYDPERRIFIVHYPVKIFSYESTDPNDTIDTDHGFWKEGNKVYHSVDKTAILDYGDFTWEDYAHL